jgi:hypothetical protein
VQRSFFFDTKNLTTLLSSVERFIEQIVEAKIGGLLCI